MKRGLHLLGAALVAGCAVAPEPPPPECVVCEHTSADVVAVALSPTGDCAFVATRDRGAYWLRPFRTELEPLPLDAAGARPVVVQAAWIAGSERSIVVVGEDQSLVVFSDKAGGHLIGRLPATRSGVGGERTRVVGPATALATHPDGGSAYVATFPGGLWRVDLRDGVVEPVLSGAEHCRGLAFSQDGAQLLAATEKGVAVWSLESGAQRVLEDPLAPGAGCESVAPGPDGSIWFAGEARIGLWDGTTPTFPDVIAPATAGWWPGLSTSRDGRNLAGLHNHGLVRTWRVGNDRSESRELSNRRATRVVTDPLGRYLLLSGRNWVAWRRW